MFKFYFYSLAPASTKAALKSKIVAEFTVSVFYLFISVGLHFFVLPAF